MKTFTDPWRNNPMQIEHPHTVRQPDEQSAKIWWAIMHVRDLADRSDVDKQVLRAATVAWMRDQRRLACEIVAGHYDLDSEELVARTEPRPAHVPRRGEEIVWDASGSLIEWLEDLDVDDDLTDFDPDSDDPDEIDW